MPANTVPQADDLTLAPQFNTSHLPAVHVVAMTTKQAAQILAVSERTVWNLISAGHLPVLKIGRSTRILSDELTTFMREGVDKVKADVIEVLENAD